MTFDKKSASPTTRSGLLVAGGVLLAVLAGLGALYGMRGKARNGEVAATGCEGAVRVAEKLKPIARGEIAALKIADRPPPATPVTFVTHDGKTLKLEDFRGRMILLNLWATWCAPCRAEMPALDRLQQTLGGPDFEVVTVNIDTTRLDRPKAFLNDVGVKKLSYYSDQSGQIFTELKKAGKAFGMPTTLLIDRNGCELGNMAGPAEWSGQDAQYLIRTALGR